MKIVDVAIRLPHRVVDNLEILSLITFHSKGKFQGDLCSMLNVIESKLTANDSNCRLWRGPGDLKPIEMAVAGADEIFGRNDISRSDIDLVIYVSVTRGFIEPSSASFFIDAMGLNCEGYDIVDACMGWSSALKTVNALMKTGDVRNALLVSCEFPMGDNGSVLKPCFTLEHPQELKEKYAAYTLGEAMTLTLLTADSSVEWNGIVEVDNKSAHLCAAPLAGYKNYSQQHQWDYISPLLGFTAHGSEMVEKGLNKSIQALKGYFDSVGNIDYLLPHSISGRLTKVGVKRAGVTTTVISTFGKLGNLATSSVPAGLCYLKQNNYSLVGKKVAAWIGASGLKFAAHDLNLAEFFTA